MAEESPFKGYNWPLDEAVKMKSELHCRYQDVANAGVISYMSIRVAYRA